MKPILKRRNIYALSFAVSICLAVAGTKLMIEAVFVLSYQRHLSPVIDERGRLLYDATLIWDNRILAVPSALISIPDRQIKKTPRKP